MANVESNDPNVIPLDVKMCAGQAVAAVAVRDSAGNIVFGVDPDGNLTAQSIQVFNHITSYATMKAALESLPTDVGGTLWIPKGSYACDSTTGKNLAHSYTALLGAHDKQAILDFSADTGVPEETYSGIILKPTVVENVNGPITRGAFVLKDFALIGPGEGVGVDTKHAITNETLTGAAFGGFAQAEMDRLTIRNWGGNGIDIGHYVDGNGDPLALGGWVGEVDITRCEIQDVGQGIVAAGDNRIWTIRRNYVEYIHKENSAAIDIQNLFSSVIENNVTQYDMYCGLKINGARGVHVISHYFETIDYLAAWMMNMDGCSIHNSFMYDTPRGFLLDNWNNCTLDTFDVQHCTVFPVKLITDAWASTVKNVEFTAGNYHDNEIGVDTEALAHEPAHIEHPFGGVGGPTEPSLMRGRTKVYVKTDAGAPTDAVYGDVIGTVVFNSNESKLYVKASAAADDWHSVVLA